MRADAIKGHMGRLRSSRRRDEAETGLVAVSGGKSEKPITAHRGLAKSLLALWRFGCSVTHEA